MSLQLSRFCKWCPTELDTELVRMKEASVGCGDEWETGVEETAIKRLRFWLGRLHCSERLSFEERRWGGESQPLGTFFSGGKIMSSVWSWLTQGAAAHLSSVSRVIWTSHLGARESPRGNVLIAWLNGPSLASKLCAMADTYLVQNLVRGGQSSLLWCCWTDVDLDL